jgi:hypothetical protein
MGEDRSTSRLHVAGSLARTICAWHLEHGESRVRERWPKNLEAYLVSRDALCHLKLTSQDEIERVAHAQRSGVWEFAYSELLAEGWTPLWNLLRPTTLGAAANLILDLLKDDTASAQSYSRFELPRGWQLVAAKLVPRVAHLTADPRKELGVLRAYFDFLAEYEDCEIGGRNLMIDLNLDTSREGDPCIVWEPSCYDLTLAAGEGCLPTLMLTGVVRASFVLGASTTQEEKAE